MLERGVYVVAFSYPVVPKGQARIRTQMSAAHSRQDIERAISAFADVRTAVPGTLTGPSGQAAPGRSGRHMLTSPISTVRPGWSAVTIARISAKPKRA